MTGGLPRISAVVVTRDRPELLADALRSLAAQRLAPCEVRIANDGTGPLDERATTGLLGVTVIDSRAGDAAGARNLAARGARGEVLAFLDDDDRWRPDHLEGLALALADPSVELAYRDAVVVRESVEHGQRIDLECRVLAHDWALKRMRTDDWIAPSALAIRRALFERLGGFDESFRFSEDWDLLLRASALTTPRRVPGITVEVRMRRDGHASQERGAERRDCLARLAAHHHLPPLKIKTFWEVAETLGAVEPPK